MDQKNNVQLNGLKPLEPYRILQRNSHDYLSLIEEAPQNLRKNCGADLITQTLIRDVILEISYISTVRGSMY